MMLQLTRCGTVLAVGCLLLLGPAAGAQVKRGPANPVEAAMVEHALDEEGLSRLIGRQANLLFQNGKREENVTLEQFVTIREKDRFRLVAVTAEGETRQRRYPAAQLFRIEIDGAQYRVNNLPSLKAAALQDVESRNAEVEQRLKGVRARLWKPLDEQERPKYIEEEKEFLKKVKEHFRQLPLQLHETKYFLFFTDMPPRQVAPYIAQLDKMNEKLGEAFGFAPGENVWRGKAVVVAFVNKPHYVEFEREFMNYNQAENAQGLCHSFPDGRVVVSCYRGDDANFFGALLVHETAHGYMHRYRSTVTIPSWLNEGIAEWVARAAVPQASELTRRRQEAASQLRQTGTFGGTFFEGGNLERWQYGAAHSIVDLLVKENPGQFQLFFNGIKEGLPWQDSLMRAYGASVADLCTLYGRSISIPRLTP